MTPEKKPTSKVNNSSSYVYNNQRKRDHSDKIMEKNKKGFISSDKNKRGSDQYTLALGNVGKQNESEQQNFGHRKLSQ